MRLLKVFAFMLLVAVSACSKEETSSEQAKNLEVLSIYSEQDGKLIRSYGVEVADTRETLYKGLMGRVSLAEDSGMIFDVNLVPADVDVAMWMKDTPVALDMLFIDANAKIYYIKENAVPYSTESIMAPARPRAVLEVNAGQVKKYGISVGDKVEHRMLKNLLLEDETVAAQASETAK